MGNKKHKRFLNIILHIKTIVLIIVLSIALFLSFSVYADVNSDLNSFFQFNRYMNNQRLHCTNSFIKKSRVQRTRL